jgi:hypothetical protein
MGVTKEKIKTKRNWLTFCPSTNPTSVCLSVCGQEVSHSASSRPKQEAPPPKTVAISCLRANQIKDGAILISSRNRAFFKDKANN